MGIGSRIPKDKVSVESTPNLEHELPAEVVGSTPPARRELVAPELPEIERSWVLVGLDAREKREAPGSGREGPSSVFSAYVASVRRSSAPKVAMPEGETATYRDALKKVLAGGTAGTWRKGLEKLAGEATASTPEWPMDRSRAHALRAAAESLIVPSRKHQEKNDALRELVRNIDRELDFDLRFECTKEQSVAVETVPFEVAGQVEVDLGRAADSRSLFVQSEAEEPSRVRAGESHLDTIVGLYHALRAEAGTALAKYPSEAVDQTIKLAMMASTQTFDAGMFQDFRKRFEDLGKNRLCKQDWDQELTKTTFTLHGDTLSVARDIAFQIVDPDTETTKARYLGRRVVDLHIGAEELTRERYALEERPL